MEIRPRSDAMRRSPCLGLLLNQLKEELKSYCCLRDSFADVTAF